MITIGIDPGKSGGIAILHEDGSVLDLFAMPKTPKDLWNALFYALMNTQEPEFAYLESVHAMPKQGVTSSFCFGENFGMLQMALAGLSIAHETVTPQRWQKAMGCLTKGDKNVTKRKAQALFPGIPITHAIADALLIAEYGRRLGNK